MFSEDSRLVQGSDRFINQWQAMLSKKFLYTLRNKLLFLIQNIMPIFFVIITIMITRNQGTFNPLPSMTVSMTQYPTAVAVLAVNSTVAESTLPFQIANEYENIVKSIGPNYGFEKTPAGQSFYEYILELGKTIQVRINSRYVAAATIGNERIVAYLNNQPLHTAPLTINLVHNAMAR